MNGRADGRHLLGGAYGFEQPVIPSATRDRAPRSELGHDDLEDEARVVLEIASELCRELDESRINPAVDQELKALTVLLKCRVDVDMTLLHQGVQPVTSRLSWCGNGQIALADRGRIGGQRLSSSICSSRQEPLCDLPHAARTDDLDALLLKELGDCKLRPF